jgi:hypothetical protein
MSKIERGQFRIVETLKLHSEINTTVGEKKQTTNKTQESVLVLGPQLVLTNNRNTRSLLHFSDVLTFMMDAEYSFSLGVFLSYIALYTAYDKQSKSLKASQLINILMLQGDGGLTHTLKEFNKAISLAGLTILLLSFANMDDYDSSELFRIALITLTVHSIYSFYEFYGFSVDAVLKDKLLKPTSIVLAVLCQSLLYFAHFSEAIPFSVLALEASLLGILHFWMYEVDYKYVLQIRPYAFLPFLVAGYVWLLHLSEVCSVASWIGFE